jgi:hypothetical protein
VVNLPSFVQYPFNHRIEAREEGGFGELTGGLAGGGAEALAQVGARQQSRERA